MIVTEEMLKKVRFNCEECGGNFYKEDFDNCNRHIPCIEKIKERIKDWGCWNSTQRKFISEEEELSQNE